MALTHRNVRANTTAEPRTVTGREAYDGAELRPFDGRPGPMDAYDLPSMVNGVAVPRKVPMLNSETKK
jgi:hypothetical protein